MDKQCQSSQNSKFAMSLQYLLKEVSDEVDFFDAGKHQSFLEVDFNTLDIKIFYKATGTIMKTWKAWWWAWSSVLKVLKVTSWQCPYNISTKKLCMDRVNFGVHQDQNFCKLDHQFLMKVDRHVQSTQKRKLVNLLQYIRQSIATVFVFYCEAKHSDTLLGSSHDCCYLFLGGCGL